MQDKHYGAVAAAAIAGFFTGSTIVATRFVVGHIDPVTIAFLRYSLGAVILSFFVGRAPSNPIRRRDILPVCLIGLGQFGLLMVLLNYGLKLVPAGLASIVFSSIPVVAFVFAVILGQETINLNRLVGIILTIIGVWVTVGLGLNFDATNTSLFGIVLVMLSAAVGGLCNVLFRPYLKYNSPLLVTLLSMLVSVVFIFTFKSYSDSSFSWLYAVSRMSILDIVLVTYLALGSSLGIYLWIWALKHDQASRVASFQALSPVVATILGSAILYESIGYRISIGLSLVVGGLIVVSRRKSEKLPMSQLKLRPN